MARAGSLVGLPHQVPKMTLIWEGEVGADLLKCKAAIQKDLVRLEEWVNRNIIK